MPSTPPEEVGATFSREVQAPARSWAAVESQGIGLRPHPRAGVSRPVGPDVKHKHNRGGPCRGRSAAFSAPSGGHELWKHLYLRLS